MHPRQPLGGLQVLLWFSAVLYVPHFLPAAEGTPPSASHATKAADAITGADGPPQESSKPLPDLRIAAEQGDADAQFSLAWMYYEGQGVRQDYGEALRWYLKAAEGGIPAAQFNLGLIYQHGTGVAQDAAEAFKWYNLAAAQGHARAREKRDRLLGEMTPVQLAEAKRRSAVLVLQNESSHPESSAFGSPDSARHPRGFGTARARRESSAFGSPDSARGTQDQAPAPAASKNPVAAWAPDAVKLFPPAPARRESSAFGSPDSARGTQDQAPAPAASKNPLAAWAPDGVRLACSLGALVLLFGSAVFLNLGGTRGIKRIARDMTNSRDGNRQVDKKAWRTSGSPSGGSETHGPIGTPVNASGLADRSARHFTEVLGGLARLARRQRELWVPTFGKLVRHLAFRHWVRHLTWGRALRAGGATLLVLGTGTYAYGYYQLLRCVVCGISIYSVLEALELKARGWVATFATLALLFNPLVPVRLDRATWMQADLLAALALLVSLPGLRKKTAA